MSQALQALLEALHIEEDVWKITDDNNLWQVWLNIFGFNLQNMILCIYIQFVTGNMK